MRNNAAKKLNTLTTNQIRRKTRTLKQFLDVINGTKESGAIHSFLPSTNYTSASYFKLI